MKRKLEILGSKATIDTINPVLKNPPYRDKDQIMVVLKLDHSIDGILSFPVFLTPLRYSAEAFLDAVRRKGEEALGQFIRKAAERKRGEKEQADRGAELDRIIAEIESSLSL